MANNVQSSVGIILVSHSQKITEGLKDLILEMNGDQVNVHAAGGTDDGRLGTSATIIMNEIEELGNCENILIFYDMGSALMSAETAIDLLDEDVQTKCKIVEGPLVEGAFVASVQSTITNDVDVILKEVSKL
ncbi:dihydroxyacetone kinase phosphoryl donor subunit DhaM [Oceanobacillus timonensis]|uniref:dihydroxyacetone kinase phosphoryl donor subunit DhaM n=1 Tax=Oceanobacillus timonensis TaxID=1926285 RepID=UPI0009B9E6CA|nr:dihydroxyacetone kinase phosphoryl donor subunit DhaM [Oceanobacillus timonensis]